MKHLQYIIICVILVISFYIWCCLRPNSEYTLLQTSIENCSTSLLNEKLPILIESHIVNVNDLLKTVLKYRFIYTKKIKNQVENKNKRALL